MKATSASSGQKLRSGDVFEVFFGAGSNDRQRTRLAVSLKNGGCRSGENRLGPQCGNSGLAGRRIGIGENRFHFFQQCGIAELIPLTDPVEKIDTGAVKPGKCDQDRAERELWLDAESRVFREPDRTNMTYRANGTFRALHGMADCFAFFFDSKCSVADPEAVY